MVILMDAGNSRIKWCWLTEKGLGTVNYRSYEELGKVDTLTALLSEQKPDQLVAVHVLGDKFDDTIRLTSQTLDIDYHIVRSLADAYGVKNAYDKPAQLGADRFVALAGAHHHYKNRAVIVIDCGTAVTIDGISSSGQHIGGVIIPGLQLWADTLINNTEMLHASDTLASEVFATNTKDGINSGRLLGLSGAINNICDVMENNMQAPIKRVLCGGDSPTLSALMPDSYELMPDLVLHGLRIINRE